MQIPGDRSGVNVNMLLSTKCEVDAAKYLDCSYGPNEMRTLQRMKSEYFPYGTNNWLIV